nr:MAG TPA: hypothetical protein [Caudoviricetes sp.]
MAKFPFMVKHNDILYEAGEEVPIGKESVKNDLPLEEKSATELADLLFEKYGIKIAAQKGKEYLLELIKEQEEKANKDENLEEDENKNEDSNNEEENEEPEENLMNQIINE